MPRQLISLVESPLERVRAAVVDGRLAVSVAVRAVGIDPEDEDRWLEAAGYATAGTSA